MTPAWKDIVNNNVGQFGVHKSYFLCGPIKLLESDTLCVIELLKQSIV